ncbi:hypothetical protein D1872_89750 [compost metagenome]
MGAKPIASHSFTKDEIIYYIRIQRTGDKLPQPARIVVGKRIWSDVGGWKGWEIVTVYDKNFDDWDYARKLYREILSRADGGSVKTII